MAKAGGSDKLKVKAKGTKIKTLYGLTAGKEGDAELQALKAGTRQVQNLVNKRIKKLKQYEKETGITSPALAAMREKGFGDGVHLKGYDVQDLREQYKAATDFVRSDTSTIPGIKSDAQGILEDLQAVGYRGKKLSKAQYRKFKELSKKFYSERSKSALYRASGGRVSQAELREHMNRQVKQLLNKGSLNTVLEMAEQRIDSMGMYGSWEPIK